MTHRSPSRGAARSRGRMENSPAPSNNLKHLKLFLALRSPGLALVLCAAALAGCGQRNSSHQVELVMGSATPTPSTTFELRFESVMVKGDRVGLPYTNSPLVIRPLVAGTFTWLSSRSGVFTPVEPLALDTKYALSLAPGLLGAEGQQSGATLRWTVTTPAFGVIAAWPSRADPNAGSEPEIKLAFNADVRAAETGAVLFIFVTCPGTGCLPTCGRALSKSLVRAMVMVSVRCIRGSRTPWP